LKKCVIKILRQIPLVYRINSAVKSYTLKKDLYRLRSYYASVNCRQNNTYSKELVVSRFKDRLAKMRPNYLVPNIGDLNLFWVGADKEQDMSGFLQALGVMGSVHTFNNNPVLGYGPLYSKDEPDLLKRCKMNSDALIDQISRQHAAKPIDAVIGQMWAQYYSKDVIDEIKKLNIPIINVSMDDRLPAHWGYCMGKRMGSVGLGENIDLVLTTTAETCQWYNAENILSMFWPLASDPNLFSSKIPLSERDIDVLFVGNNYGIRGKIVNYLDQRGLKITCYGHGWKNGHASHLMNAALSRRARIILGIGTVGHTHDVYTLKLRDFDAAMTGALYITHRNPELLSIFEEGKHLECYETPDELYRKLVYYLANPEKIEYIASNALQAAVKDHCWEYRLRTTLLELGLALP